jgi:hypothetical protein
MTLENEVVISEVFFENSSEGFQEIPHIPVPIACHWNYNSSFP